MKEGTIKMKKIHQIQGQVTLGKALGDFFKGYCDFMGRTTRAGYWWVTFILILLAIFGIVLLPVVVFSTAQLHKNALGSSLIYLIIALLIFLALVVPSAALSVRRYRDAGLRGRGFLVLWIVSAASSYTTATQAFSNISEFGTNGYIQPISSGNSIFTFLSYAIGLLFFVMTLLPTDALTTTSKNEFVRFFLRSKSIDN